MRLREDAFLVIYEYPLGIGYICAVKDGVLQFLSRLSRYRVIAILSSNDIHPNDTLLGIMDFYRSQADPIHLTPDEIYRKLNGIPETIH